jgi:hypothetical protein
VRYLLGVAAALGAGIATNVGILIQNGAVGRVRKGEPLMRSLLRSPAWLSSIGVQFVLGSPLYLAAVGLIGPAIVPGLMSVGLVVLTLGAVIIQKERLTVREGAGIAMVGCAVVCFGLCRLSIDVYAYSLLDAGLLLRSAAFTAALVAIAVGCGAGAAASLRGAPRKASGGSSGPGAARASLFHAAAAGVWYCAGNLALGFILAGFARFAAGAFIPAEILVFLAASALCAAGNLLGVARTQHAFAHGRAVVAVPLQNGVSQVLPVLVFFLVYRPYVPAPASFAFMAAAAACLAAGALLLTGKRSQADAS